MKDKLTKEDIEKLKKAREKIVKEQKPVRK